MIAHRNVFHLLLIIGLWGLSGCASLQTSSPNATPVYRSATFYEEKGKIRKLHERTLKKLGENPQGISTIEANDTNTLSPEDAKAILDPKILGLALTPAFKHDLQFRYLNERWALFGQSFSRGTAPEAYYFVALAKGPDRTISFLEVCENMSDISEGNGFSCTEDSIATSAMFDIQRALFALDPPPRSLTERAKAIVHGAFQLFLLPFYYLASI